MMCSVKSLSRTIILYRQGQKPLLSSASHGDGNILEKNHWNKFKQNMNQNEDEQKTSLFYLNFISAK